MRVSILLVMMIIMALVQISLWMAIPREIRNFFFANPILAFIANLMGSMLIVGFTGIASMVGTANLGASVVFFMYVIYYKKKTGISGLCIKWFKILWIIPIIPYLSVKYQPKGEIK